MENCGKRLEELARKVEELQSQLESERERYKQDLHWYEAQWSEDKARWEREKAELKRRLEEVEEEALRLRGALAAEKGRVDTACQQALEEVRRVLREKERALAEAKALLEKVEKSVQTLSRPPLGEGFLRRLGEQVALWDQVLVQEASTVSVTSLPTWLDALWQERREALAQALAGEAVDWRRVHTGLVLEWALLAWLEGIRDA